MRLVSLGFGLFWTALAGLGLYAWQTSSDIAIQNGTVPPILDVFPMVMVPGILASFSLAHLFQMWADKRTQAACSADAPPG